MVKTEFLVIFILITVSFQIQPSVRYELTRWEYCIVKGENVSEWKTLDMSNTLNKDIRAMNKGDTVYYKTVIYQDELNDFLKGYAAPAFYFGKIEGEIKVFLNEEKKIFTSLYDTQTVFFEIDKEDTISRNEITLTLGVKKIISRYKPNLEVVPYMDDYRNIRREYIQIYFLQLIIGFCIFLIGLYFISFYSWKFKKSEYLVFFLLCLSCSLSAIIQSPLKIYLLYNFDIDFQSVEKLNFMSFYIMPFLGFVFLIKLFKEKTKTANFLYLSLFVLTCIQMFVILILNLEQMSRPVFIFQIITVLYAFSYGYFAVKNMLKRPGETAYILIGGIILCLSILLTIAGSWKLINFGNRFPFYTVGMLVFTFSALMHLSRQFSKADKNLLELTDNFEKKIEERTKQIELISQQKTNFFINVAHDLKTPLTFIENYIDRDIETRGISEPIRIVKHNLTKLKREIINILDVERINNRKFFSNIKTVNISRILKTGISMFNETALTKKITLVPDIENDIFVSIDPYDLDRIIFNLIDNALKYTDENGTVKAVLKKENGKAVFLVEDTGIGISENEQDNIFKPYYQVNFNTANRQGIGMGLFIVKQVLENIKGGIKVESELGKGTKFEVTIDLAEEQSMAVEQIDHIKPLNANYELNFKQAEYDSGKRTILIVEDNRELLFYLHDSFIGKYNVFYALDGNEACSKLNIIPKPDLIISDIIMSEMDGFEFFENVKKDKALYDIPLIFLTARSNSRIKMKGLKLGAVDFIIKPFKIKELMFKVDSIISNRLKSEMKNKSVFKNQILNALHEEKTENDAISTLLFEKKISQREAEVIGLILKGKEIKEIGGELDLSSSGVKKRINNIYKKFSVNNKIELVNYIKSFTKNLS